ncbi:MAG: divalent metal cation transporter, partial [Chloroflexi bacterium]|nr:divalent metal cation transporter [Chloroflexota bacterium]
MRRPSRRGDPTPRATARRIHLLWPRCAIRYLRAVGPGVMAGLADNDPAGITAYSIAGAVAGNRQLWLLVLATFMVQAVQVTSARLGGLTGQGVLRLVRRRYGSAPALAVALTAVAANQASLIADTAALGAALELLTGISWRWFILPAVLLLLGATVILNFREIRLLYLAVGTLALSYVAAAVLVHPDWGAVLRGTFLPSLPTTLAEAAAAVALLGTTVSPYLLVWEAEGEREVARTRLDLRL